MPLTDDQLHTLANFSREVHKIGGPLRTAVNARQALGSLAPNDKAIETLTRRWLSTFKAHFGFDFPIDQLK